MILGIDISTSITGFCVLDVNGEVIRSGAWDMRNKNKFPSEFIKAQYIKEELLQLKVQYPIEKICIEKPFMFFKSGGSSAKTMATLQRFNGIVSWITYETFGQPPQYITAASARKAVGIKIAQKKDTKKEVVAWLLENVSNFDVEYTAHGNPKPKYYDIADAIVVAMATQNKVDKE